MKRARTNSVTYAGTSKAKYARGTRGNPIVLDQKVNRAVTRAVSKVVEKKGVDGRFDTISTIANTTNTNDDAVTVNLIAPGSASFNRVGRQVTLKSLRVWGEIVHTNDNNASAPYSGNNVRMVVVWDKIPGGSVPTYDAIFGVTNQQGSETTSFYDPIKYDSMDRFRVISDNIIQCHGQGGGADPTTSKIATEQSYQFDKYIKLPNLRCNYSGQSTPCTIADIGQGALYIYFRAVANSTTNYCSVRVGSAYRLRYTD